MIRRTGRAVRVGRLFSFRLAPGLFWLRVPADGPGILIKDDRAGWTLATEGRASLRLGRLRFGTVFSLRSAFDSTEPSLFS